MQLRKMTTTFTSNSCRSVLFLLFISFTMKILQAMSSMAVENHLCDSQALRGCSFLTIELSITFIKSGPCLILQYRISETVFFVF